MEGCKCKVGSCPICGSSCKSCECACDSIDSKLALNRARGQRGPQKRSTTSPQSDQEEREAAKRARIDLLMAIAQDGELEQTPKQMQTVIDVWKCLRGAMHKLPSEHSRMNDTSLKTHDGSRTGWNTVVHSVYSAAVLSAEILYLTKP